MEVILPLAPRRRRFAIGVIAGSEYNSIPFSTTMYLQNSSRIYFISLRLFQMKVQNKNDSERCTFGSVPADNQDLRTKAPQNGGRPLRCVSFAVSCCADISPNNNCLSHEVPIATQLPIFFTSCISIYLGVLRVTYSSYFGPSSPFSPSGNFVFVVARRESGLFRTFV